jgi:hypothetical protein
MAQNAGLQVTGAAKRINDMAGFVPRHRIDGQIAPR